MRAPVALAFCVLAAVAATGRAGLTGQVLSKFEDARQCASRL